MDRLYAELSQLPRANDAAALGRWVDAQLEAKTARLMDAWSYPPAFEKMKRDAAVNPELIGLYQVVAGADDFYLSHVARELGKARMQIHPLDGALRHRPQRLPGMSRGAGARR